MQPGRRPAPSAAPYFSGGRWRLGNFGKVLTLTLKRLTNKIEKTQVSQSIYNLLPLSGVQRGSPHCSSHSSRFQTSQDERENSRDWPKEQLHTAHKTGWERDLKKPPRAQQSQTNTKHERGGKKEDSSGTGFPSLGTVDIWGRTIPRRGNHPVHCRMLCRPPGHHPRDASSTPHSSTCDNVSGQCQMSPGDKVGQG